MVYDFNSLTKQADEASNRDKFYTDFSDVDPNKLHQITELTDWMRTKAKGSDVREIIAQLFERTWLENIKEGNANMEVAQARGTHPNLRSRLDESDKKQRENTAQLAQKANKDEVTNVITPKGTLAYASLPTSGNEVGWYYYCPDGDGTHGAGNYVWNGTSWYFGGTGDEGYNLLKKDLKEDLTYVNDKFSYSENRLTLENLEADKYIDRDGSILSYPGWSLSTFLPVEPKTTYIWLKSFNGEQVANIYFGLFDKNKKWIGNGGVPVGGNIHLVTTDENTAYVRVSQASTNFTDDAMICRKELFDNGLSAFIPFSVGLKNNNSYALKSELSDYALKSELSTTNDKSIAYTINRFGSGYGQYESFDAVKKAIKAGFNGVRLNLQFSSDGEIVLWHDPYLNQHYSNVYDGNNVLVEYSDTTKVYINGTTFEKLNQYKFGDKSYSAGVLTLTPEILLMLKNSGSILVLEQKSAITVDNATKVMNLLYKYGMVEKTYFACSDANTMDILYNVSSIPHYGLMYQNASENLLNIYETRESYKLFWWAWDTTSLTEAQAIRLKNIGTVLWAGDFYTADNIIKFLCTDANNNFTGFETSVPIISDILKTNYIN